MKGSAMTWAEGMSAEWRSLRPDGTLAQFALLIAVIAVGVFGFLISVPAGIALTFVSTACLVFVAPALSPMLIVAALLFQNTLVATITPAIASPETFDTIRGANFVILGTVFAVLLATAFAAPQRLPVASRRWIWSLLAILVLIAVYMVLGAARGVPKDAIIYFRNTVTPVMTFGIALIAASYYRIAFNRLLLVMGVVALAYGYCELLFRLDFLAIFHGDDYLALRFADRLAGGIEINHLVDPGEAHPGLTQIMTVPLFNLTQIREFLPDIFRLSGPNFHPISFAYAIAIITSWRLFHGRWGFLIAAAPILVAVGSKGAMLVVFASLMLLGMRLVMRTRAAVLTLSLVLAGYIGAAIVVGRAEGDYHVLGFLAGMRDFASNPIGQGLGIGGNLSSLTATLLDWRGAQAAGIAQVPVESALGVMLYQMGAPALLFFAWLIAIIRAAMRCRSAHAASAHLFAPAVLSAIMANAVLQEEAVFSPLALGFALLLVGLQLGRALREQASETKSSRAPGKTVANPIYGASAPRMSA